MRKQQSDDTTSCSRSVCFHTDSDVVMQLADMKDQTVYMKQFRAALGSALDEVKHLRSELAQEKSRGIETLKTTPNNNYNMVSGNNSQRNQQCEKTKNRKCVSGDLKGIKESQEMHGLQTQDLSEVIAESERRLDRVKDAIVERRDVVRNLRKKLQLSSKTLVRRETKLEEKLNQESDLKTELQKLSLEKSTLEESSRKLLDELQQERLQIALKDQEVTSLQKKMSLKEEQINDLYCKLGARDRELYETKNQLRNPDSPCLQCSWMREYIRKLEHNLQRYRYSTTAPNNPVNSPHFPGGSYVDKEELNNSPWVHGNPLNHNNATSQATSSRNQWSTDANYKQIHYNKVSTTEAYRRQLALNRQRHQEFRNAAQVLSPIREDAEEPNISKTSNSNESDSSSQRYNQHQVNENGVPYFKQSYTTVNGSQGLQSHNPTGNAPYFTVRSGERSPMLPEDKVENKNLAYLHVTSNKSRPVLSGAGERPCMTSSSNTKKMSGSLAHDMTRPVQAEIRDVRPPVPSVSDVSKPNPCNSNNESSLLHGTPVRNNVKSTHPPSSAPDHKLFSYSHSLPHSLPLLGSFKSSPCSSVVSTTDDNTSDAGTTGCSSDSGISRQPSQGKKVVKTRRAKRKPNRHVFFRNHKIDVTRFTMIEFRQIMWSICNNSKAADDFLHFLATEAKRLQNDPQWSGKHSLGTPDEWLSLKGSY